MYTWESIQGKCSIDDYHKVLYKLTSTFKWEGKPGKTQIIIHNFLPYLTFSHKYVVTQLTLDLIRLVNGDCSLLPCLNFSQECRP